MMRCNLCPEEKPTLIPYDEVGVALMTQHLESEHGVKR